MVSNNRDWKLPILRATGFHLSQSLIAGTAVPQLREIATSGAIDQPTLSAQIVSNFLLNSELKRGPSTLVPSVKYLALCGTGMPLNAPNPRPGVAPISENILAPALTAMRIHILAFRAHARA